MKKIYWIIGGIVGGVVIYTLHSISIFFPVLFWTLQDILRIPITIAQYVWVWFFKTFLSWMQEDPDKYFDMAQDIHRLFTRAEIIVTGIIPGILLGWVYGKIKTRRQTATNY